MKVDALEGIAGLLNMSRKQFYDWFLDTSDIMVSQNMSVEDKNLIQVKMNIAITNPTKCTEQ